eukprot:CAMPEP_0172377006 /NCGR_PEP_ID=MMETSP1060-20121228/68678_1 /TAXON_ID=37318 /ORGANISM="Pseudo-nitzschia pungens, Strain cf. cingulata" /LENGTH=616 /DNA_ID=CAMNT_0013104673 /DNA_START=332 /DNA_END=2183 /DNA_ORIENTATION=-
MACYKSLLARRIVLWYILLGSIVIFPLTLNVSLGCRFVTVVNKDDTENTGDVKNTVNNYDAQGLGPFNLAIYDSQQIVLGGTSDNFNTFLGCVDYSLFWREATGNDFAFTMHRVASGCLLAFTTLATIICTCLQCFTKRGKSHLWNVMRAFYIGALLSQGLMYSVFGSEMCKEEDNKCTPGRNGVAGAFNVVLLMGMVVATFLSLPPRNPVFQCWGSSESDYESDGDGSSTEEEDEVMRKFKSFGDAGGEKSVSGVENDSVSLFGGSRMSRKSRTTTKSLKSKLTEEDEVASAAENGLATAGEGESVSSSRSKQKSVVRVTTVDDGSSLASGKSGKSASSKMMPAISRYMFMGSKSSKDNDNHNHNHNHNHNDNDNDNGSVTSARSKKKREFQDDAGYFQYMFMGSKSSKDNDNHNHNHNDNDNGSVTSARSKKSTELASGDDIQADPILSVSSNISTHSGEVANFITQLIEMTELTDGGRRVKQDEQENLVEIIDEYPKEEGREIESSPSSDVVKIRTEYYDMGSRTTKEITHQDGSCTIVTTILADCPSTSQRESIDAPIETNNSTASIQSTNSSKYQVLATASAEASVSTFEQSEKEDAKRKPVRQGEFCLSV